MRRLGELSLVLFGLFGLASCEGLFGVDFDGLSARAPIVDAGVDTDSSTDIVSCSAAEKSCGTRCAQRSDPETGCGAPSCLPCPGAEHGKSGCSDQRCALTCDGGFYRCTSGCCALQSAPVAAGFNHTCATARSGALYCWGSNTHGQLGDQSQERRVLPALVFGLEGGARSVATGADFTLATTPSGSTLSWGSNALGNLGNGMKDGRATPGPIPGLDETSYVKANGFFGCAVSRAGRVACWGYNVSGVVGSGTSSSEVRTPEPVRQAEPFVQLATSPAHACAVGVSGALYCWGTNDRGQLGPSQLASAKAPVLVASIGEVDAVATGASHTCVIARDGAVRCWGDNSTAQLGVGDTNERLSIVDVIGPNGGARSIVAGSRCTCVTLSSGAVQCWGLLRTGLGVGTGATEIVRRPTNVDVGGPVASLSAGAEHACARLLDGRVRCWGANQAGQLGDGTLEDQLTPVDVALPP